MSRTARLADYIDELARICSRAGEEILRHYAGEGAGWQRTKPDDSPLTAADLASHEIVLAGLRGLRYPVLSEESDSAQFSQRRQWRRFWLVDPLDGTREFLQRTDEFTINIALVDAGRAIMGVIHAPVPGETYVGIPGQFARVYAAGKWRDIHCRELPGAGAIDVFFSRRHGGGRLEGFLERLAGSGLAVRQRRAGSALKFCRLALGEADVYPRFMDCSEWDTAAGQALVEAAGGMVRDLRGRPLRYNRRASLLSPHFVACSAAAQPLVARALRHIA